MRLVLREAGIVAFAISAEGLAVGALGFAAFLFDGRRQDRDVDVDFDDDDDGRTVGAAEGVGLVL